MSKKTIYLIIIALLIAGISVYVLSSTKNQLPSSLPEILTQQEDKLPSKTLKEYLDPSGFSFNYPDNISLANTEELDTNTYADIQLYSNEVSGSLNLKITDSKLKSLDEWVNLNKEAAKQPPKEVMFGTLKAMEIRTSDRLLLGAFDQKILFTIEIPLVKEEFWMKVYERVIKDFSFVQPSQENTFSSVTSTSDVIFEGEEVIE